MGNEEKLSDNILKCSRGASFSHVPTLKYIYIYMHMYHMYTHRVHNIEKRTSRSEKNIMSPCLSLHSLRTDRRSFLDTKAPPVAQLGPNAQASSFPLLGAPEFLSRALPCWSAVFIKGNRSDILDRE